ncbi:MAG: ROK family protein [Anaerolineae bacterium]|nr:ROK family protein [Anaerolineae bacterium]
MQRILTGSSGSAIKSHNLRAVLFSLLRQEAVSRAQLAQLTQLSSTTITNLITELLDQGIVAEDTDSAATQPVQRAVGRPQTALRLVAASRTAVGVHFDVDHINVAVTDLFGKPLAACSAPHPADRAPQPALAETVRLVRQAISESGVDTRLIVGVGVGASGLVDAERGVNVIAPNLGWRDVPLRDWLTAELGLPVCIENNVRTMALAEVMFGAGRGVNALAFVYARVGVGAGFVVNGEIYRGSAEGAGEIGHTTIIPNGGIRCRCGNTGCLETLVSEPALLRAAHELAEAQPRSLLAEHLRTGQGLESVFQAARAGDEPTRAMLQTRAQYMGIALANLVNILNPELIVMGGLFRQGRDLLLPTVEATIRARAFARLGERVGLQTASFDGRAGVIGAATLALNTFFYQQTAEAG